MVKICFYSVAGQVMTLSSPTKNEVSLTFGDLEWMVANGGELSNEIYPVYGSLYMSFLINYNNDTQPRSIPPSKSQESPTQNQ